MICGIFVIYSHPVDFNFYHFNILFLISLFFFILKIAFQFISGLIISYTFTVWRVNLFFFPFILLVSLFIWMLNYLCFIFSWRIIALQCVGFFHRTKHISHKYKCTSSLLNLPPSPHPWQRNECESAELRWMNLEFVIQSEVSQKEKIKYLYWHIYMKSKNMVLMNLFVQD